jgi:lipoate-protein ligase A
VAAPEGALPPGREASYGRIGEALLRALRSLGIPAERVPRDDRGGSPHLFDCFAVPAAEEIAARGRKLAGSAQRRGGGAILQHGSIRLSPDPAEALRAAGLFPASGTSLAELGLAPDPERLASALVAAFAGALGADLEPGSLDPIERESAARRVELWSRDPLAAPER